MSSGRLFDAIFGPLLAGDVQGLYGLSASEQPVPVLDTNCPVSDRDKPALLKVPDDLVDALPGCVDHRGQFRLRQVCRQLTGSFASCIAQDTARDTAREPFQPGSVNSVDKPANVPAEKQDQRLVEHAVLRAKLIESTPVHNLDFGVAVRFRELMSRAAVEQAGHTKAISRMVEGVEQLSSVFKQMGKTHLARDDAEHL